MFQDICLVQTCTAKERGSWKRLSAGVRIEDTAWLSVTGAAQAFVHVVSDQPAVYWLWMFVEG